MAKARAARKPRRKGTRRVSGFLPPESRLTLREARFAIEYVVNENGADAARKAGYSPRSAREQASRLLTRVNVQAAVAHARDELLARSRVSADSELRDIVIGATLDFAEFFGPRRKLLAVSDMPPHVRRALQSFEVVIRNVAGGDGHTDTVIKVKSLDKARMHQVLARALGLDKGDGQERPRVPAFALPEGTTGVDVI